MTHFETAIRRRPHVDAADFVSYELRSIVTTFGNEIPDDFDFSDLFDRCLSAGLIVWDDAYDEARNVYLLNYQGFRWAINEDGEMGDAAFWGIVEEVLT